MPTAVQQTSPDLAPAPNSNLSSTQVQVVAALAQGFSVTAAAQEAGIHRTTIHHWLRSDPEFKTAVENAELEFVEALKDQVRELSFGALETLQNLMGDPNTRDAIRLKTALAVLERPSFPNRGWNLPARIESDDRAG